MAAGSNSGLGRTAAVESCSLAAGEQRSRRIAGVGNRELRRRRELLGWYSLELARLKLRCCEVRVAAVAVGRRRGMGSSLCRARGSAGTGLAPLCNRSVVGRHQEGDIGFALEEHTELRQLHCMVVVIIESELCLYLLRLVWRGLVWVAVAWRARALRIVVARVLSRHVFCPGVIRIIIVARHVLVYCWYMYEREHRVSGQHETR